jgi:hypothetical protein
MSALNMPKPQMTPPATTMSARTGPPIAPAAVAHDPVEKPSAERPAMAMANIGRM